MLHSDRLAQALKIQPNPTCTLYRDPILFPWEDYLVAIWGFKISGEGSLSIGPLNALSKYLFPQHVDKQCISSDSHGPCRSWILSEGPPLRH